MNSYNKSLKKANREMLYSYADRMEFAVTLTLKQSALVYNKDYYLPRRQYLNKSVINSTIRYFKAVLTHHLFGNTSKHKNKQDWAKPLIIISIEGLENNKRPHLHIALGNIPKDKKSKIQQIIEFAWQKCDFGHKQKEIKEIYDAHGWIDYITKEIGVCNNDALDVIGSLIPNSIKNLVLRTKINCRYKKLNAHFFR
jgi:hypothetical protein